MKQPMLLQPWKAGNLPPSLAIMLVVYAAANYMQWQHP